MEGGRVMDATLWQEISGGVMISIPVTLRVDWQQCRPEISGACLTIHTRRTMVQQQMKPYRELILKEAHKHGLDIQQVVIEGPETKTLHIETPPELTPELPAEAQDQISDLKRRLAEAERKAAYYEQMASQQTPQDGAGGVNLAFLLPALPQMSNATAKAILTLLALGGAVRMPAKDFAKFMGVQSDGVTYKRMFAGSEGVVDIDGKNIEISSTFIPKIDRASISDEPTETQKLKSHQLSESEKLMSRQLLPSEIDEPSTFTPPHDMNECKKKIIPIEGKSSFMSHPHQLEVLRFASDQLDFNPQFPPDRLREYDPIKAMALVLQAKHHRNATNPAGMWRDMINHKQRPSNKWLEEVYQYLDQYQVQQSA